MINLEHALPYNWKSIISLWLSEDAPSFDFAGAIAGDSNRKAILYAKSRGIVAGKPFFEAVFEHLGCTVEWSVNDGDEIKTIRQQCAVVTGPARAILLGERVALNLLARCSGIATCSRNLLNLLRQVNESLILAGTRKTTPGIRLLEKYGMIVGGIDPHRQDLSSMIMLKDNHIAACDGKVRSAIEAARSLAGFSVKIEVEVGSQEQAEQAIEAGANIIMLDNMNLEDLYQVSKNLKEKYTNGSYMLECSGNITPANIQSYGKCTNIDIISSSYVHQQATTLDYSLKLTE